MMANSPSTSPIVDIKDDDEVSIIYTSGVLGRQKGVLHTHASLMGPLGIISAGVGRGREGVVIDTVPFFYLFGLGEVLFGSIMEGATVVIIPHFTPRVVLEAIEKERGSIVFGVPAVHNALAMLRDGVIKNYDFSSLRAASSAGAKSSPRLMKMLEDKFKLTFCETYGLSELFVVSMSTLSNHKLGTVGKPICDIKIIDDNGREVPRGEVGEAIFRVPWAMKEYYKAPDLTAQVFKDGWFYTGDLVRMVEDGYLEYVEKKSFIIVTPSGLKISPWEVEDVFLRHPGIAEAAYVGVNDGRGGQVPTAFIVAKEKQGATVEEIVSFCRQDLADFKLPKKFEFVDSIPKTGSGKIDRRRLKEGIR
jgi:long-chain acyl-CoA synthetase